MGSVPAAAALLGANIGSVPAVASCLLCNWHADGRTCCVRDAILDAVAAPLAMRHALNAALPPTRRCAGIRQGDAAQMAFIEYVDREGELRPARPPRSLLPAAAQAAVDAAAAQQR